MDYYFKLFFNTCYPKNEDIHSKLPFNNNKPLTIQHLYSETFHSKSSNLSQSLSTIANINESDKESLIETLNEITIIAQMNEQAIETISHPVGQPRSQPLIFKNKTRKANSVTICSKDYKIKESTTDSNYLLPYNGFDFSNKKKSIKSIFFSTNVAMANKEKSDVSEVSEVCDNLKDKEKCINVIHNDADSLYDYNYFINNIPIPIAVDFNSEKQNKSCSLIHEVNYYN